jgi:hypothetical protein
MNDDKIIFGVMGIFWMFVGFFFLFLMFHAFPVNFIFMGCFIGIGVVCFLSIPERTVKTLRLRMIIFILSIGLLVGASVGYTVGMERNTELDLFYSTFPAGYDYGYEDGFCDGLNATVIPERMLNVTHDYGVSCSCDWFVRN